MRHGLFVAPFDGLSDPRVVAELAAVSEDAGWDGFFVWDHVLYRPPVQGVADPWVVLAAAAVATERVLLGPMVTPVARRRPHVLARQATSLDQLSGGRLVLGVGLGLDRSGRELSAFGEELDDRTRAEMLDEGLDLITALWTGERVDHDGPHYRAADVAFLPRPVQQPRIPVWVAGRWPNRRPLRRAARWDGLFLIDTDGGPDDLRSALEVVAAERGGLDGFEVVVNGPPGEDPRPWADAGATWWLLDPESTDAGFVIGLAEAGPTRA